MSYSIAFELSRWASVHYCTGAGILWGLSIISASFFLRQFGTSGHIRLFPLILTAALTAALLVSAVFTTVDTVHMSRVVRGALDADSPSACVVEGRVSACRIDKRLYRKGEGSFEVDGIVFDYKRVRNLPGYHGAGQLIREDGQQVRITYLPYGPGGDNIILRIEFADEQPEPLPSEAVPNV